jgi:hypothetical protein
MNTGTLRVHIEQGIWGAIIVFLLVKTFAWIFSLGMTIIDFGLILLLFLPVPLLIGGIAGALVWRLDSSLTIKLSFWVGVMAMFYGYFVGMEVNYYLIEPLGWGYRLFSIVVPGLVGILFDLFFVGCIALGRKVYKAFISASAAHDMNTGTLRVHIEQGILGAIIVFVLVETFTWMFSSGRTTIDFAWRLLTFLPVPLLIGGIAGALVWRLDSSLTIKLSFWVGVLGMVCGYFVGVYVYDYLIEPLGWGDRLFSIVVPGLVGILFDLFFVGCIGLGRKVYKVLTRT